MEARIERQESTGCWLWTGGVTTGGYSVSCGGLAIQLAHRVMYAILLGDTELRLVHLCGVSLCVNPDHMEAVTMGEIIKRGQTPPARHSRKTWCNNGHEFTEDNTRRIKGHRVCKRCKLDQSRTPKTKARQAAYRLSRRG
ncbi:MAG: hypothetical protein V3S82_10350 [Dehalococcoidia bacterium]